ncbi:MAG: FAD-dependent monooxygenase [Cyclobacteriaceae bacterium]|nr:FAD-dependent monooxygenase [Cyclobacteriaceae bacterium]
MKKITIIGAGIGGLTTAIALKKQGFEVEIFEQSKEFTNAGSGILLAPNAMQVFKTIAVYNDVLQMGNYVKRLKAVTKNLSTLSNMEYKKFEDEYGVKTIAIHRATLHKVLMSHLSDIPIHVNKKVESVYQENEEVQISFTDGSHHKTELLIGADGLHSPIRKSIFNNTSLRDSGQVCWRGISEIKLNGGLEEELNECWGKGKRFGFVRISYNQIYWFAVLNKKQYPDSNTNLTSAFELFHPTILNLIKSTPAEKIIHNEIWDLKPIENWFSGNICLLGDAAHATTPNMGQGAAQAIESALALSLCLKESPDNTQKAFQRYQELRKEKANYITNTSWRIGKIAQTNNTVLCILRNLISKVMPASVMEKQNKKVYDINTYSRPLI